MNESLFITPDDSTTKRDIMSLLVRARANAVKVKTDSGIDANIHKNLKDYRMSNEEMMDQVVCALLNVTLASPVFGLILKC